MTTNCTSTKASHLSRWLFRLCLAAFILVGSTSIASAEEIAIAKADNPASDLSKKSLKKMLLGKTKKWKNGDKVVIATLTGGSVHDTFIKKYAGKTAKQFTNYWRKMVFSGKGKMPKSFESEEDLVAFVAETDGAVGYIDSATAQDGVKAIAIK